MWPVKMSDELLAWLSVWSEVQMICIWSSWCHCLPIIFCFIKIGAGLTFLVPAYPGCPGKWAVKTGVCLSVLLLLLVVVEVVVIVGVSFLNNNNNTTTVLWLFVRDCPGEPVPEKTLTHPPSWSSCNLYQLLPSTAIRSILPVQITCLAIFLHNLSPCPLWSSPNQCLLFTAHAHTIAPVLL